MSVLQLELKETILRSSIMTTSIRMWQDLKKISVISLCYLTPVSLRLDVILMLWPMGHTGSGLTIWLMCVCHVGWLHNRDPL